jgi:hypothetical protein
MNRTNQEIEEGSCGSSTESASSRKSALRHFITNFMSQFRKRKCTANHTSDRQDSQPPSKRNRAASQTSTMYNMMFGEYFRRLLRKDSKVTENPVEQDHEHVSVSDRVKQIVAEKAKMRMKTAEMSGKLVFDPNDIIQLALHWMSNLEHQKDFLDDIDACCCGQPSRFRDIEPWANFHVERAERQIRLKEEEKHKETQEKLRRKEEKGELRAERELHAKEQQAKSEPLVPEMSRWLHRDHVTARKKKLGKQRAADRASIPQPTPT